MKIIGRLQEQQRLLDCLESKRPEFLVVYGRRRVGKTYLIKEYFNDTFSFYATGVAKLNTKGQLRAFSDSLRQYGDTEKKMPKDWFEAFSRLRMLLEKETVFRDSFSNKRIVFLDEVPWMATARSDFESALDYFWNSWASSQSDILFIICGSATSWIIEHVLNNTGGLYNRVTKQIRLLPFTLKECQELYEMNGIHMSFTQVIESYMVFGGIPYYINYFDKRLSLAQNIDVLCFSENGQLHYEYNNLFQSLFKNAQKHVQIIEAISKKRAGILRTELSDIPEIGDGELLTKALKELEQCGFIRKYKNFVKNKSGYYYQVIDPFILFHLNFLKEQKFNSWLSYINTPSYYAWTGLSFEIVCLNHIPQIKTILGISGVESMEYAWRGKENEAQIDLLIDRRDGVINICEMKYTTEPFSIDATYEKNLNHKIYSFQEETKTKKSVHLTMICANGLKHTAYSNIVLNEINGTDLLK